jgi:hypothetical protein
MTRAGTKIRQDVHQIACMTTMCGSRTGGWLLPGVMSD